LRFLLDESLSPRLGELLGDAGHDVVHARDVALMSASDPVVLAAALQHRRVLLTLDADFGALVALSGARQPSIVLFRGEVTRRPEGQATLLLANLDQIAAALTEGAVIVIGDERVRVRPLPVERDQ
jgi:predicted nuclease of predicted toxin-antitoxin system